MENCPEVVSDEAKREEEGAGVAPKASIKLSVEGAEAEVHPELFSQLASGGVLNQALHQTLRQSLQQTQLRSTTPSSSLPFHYQVTVPQLSLQQQQ
jgi:hypothetical protein